MKTRTLVLVGMAITLNLGGGGKELLAIFSIIIIIIRIFFSFPVIRVSVNLMSPRKTFSVSWHLLF